MDFDIPGDYLHAEFPDDQKVLMRLRGRFVNTMCEINPEHKRNISYESVS